MPLIVLFAAYDRREVRFRPARAALLIVDMQKVLDKTKYPFFDHSCADFFIALQHGEVVVKRPNRGFRASRPA